MKKLSKIFIAICTLFLLSGCMKYNVSMGIDKDKSMNLQVIVAIDEQSLKEMMNSTGNDSYDDDSLSSLSDMSEGKEVFKKRGYEVEDYSEGNYNGIIATLKIKNIDNVSVEEDLKVILSDILEEDFDDSKFFKVEKKSDKNIYTANFIYEVGESDDSDEMSNVPGLEVKYTVKLPYKAISDNADSKRNNELTWNVSFNEQTDINFSFEIPNEEDKEDVSTENDNENAFIGFISNNAMIIGLAALALVIVMVVIILLVSKGKKKNKNKQSSSVQEKSMDKVETILDNEQLVIDASTVATSDEIIENENTQTEGINNEVKTDESIQSEVDNNSDQEELADVNQEVVNNNLEEKEQENSNEVRVCKSCGAEIQDGQKFCMNCGNKLD